MEFKPCKYGVIVSNNNISIELNKDEVIKLLFVLKKDKYWFNILKRIIKADKDTYVGKGNCVFPASCNEWFICEKKYCNADVCSNGYAYRMS